MRLQPALLVVLGAWMAACSGPGVEADGNTDADLGVWAPIHSAVRSAVAESGVGGLGLSVYDSSDHKVFERMYGNFSPERRVTVASGSKLVAGLVLLNLVARGVLSLDDTTGRVLGWTGPQAEITLRHLMSLTSGLTPTVGCTSARTTSLAQCVADIGATPLAEPVGTRFDYGSTHLHVAARMAEVRTGRGWNDIFRSTLANPLGLAEDARFYTGLRDSVVTANPLVAGGLHATMNEYSKLLAIAFHRGQYSWLSFASPASFDEQAREPFPSVSIGISPFATIGLPFRYGLASWLECSTPAQGCDVLSSPGVFGWTPWYDRTHGYYAVIGMDQSSGDVTFAIHLQQRLKPLIVQAMGG